MSLYLKQIEQLVALQKVDNEIIRLKEELASAPQEVSVLEENFVAVQNDKTQLLEKVGYLREQDKRLNTEIEEDNLKIKKSKNKLMMVGNTREYHAMMREMDNMEKLNRLREEEKMTLVEELQRQEEAMGQMDEQVDSIKSDLEEKKKSLQSRIDAANQRLAELNRQRQDAGKNVPPPVLGRYEFIRSRLAHPVIVFVEQGVCSGCNISIPPQSFIELQKGHQIMSCPNCQRLIYWCEHFTDEAHKPASAKTEAKAEAKAE